MLTVKMEKPTAENCRWVLLTQGKFAIIDRDALQLVSGFRWVAVKWNFRWYAYSYTWLDGTRSRVAMHRLIASTPPGELTHHLNKNSLDNRRSNLLNMTCRAHGALHGIRRFGRKKKRKTTIANST